ncbi:MAG: hypothetical protein OEZ37_12565, partial [Gemmatimonadota bacterium]|nr:hypothetical protein [Gemmatimonadota bacterium]
AAVLLFTVMPAPGATQEAPRSGPSATTLLASTAGAVLGFRAAGWYGLGATEGPALFYSLGPVGGALGSELALHLVGDRPGTDNSVGSQLAGIMAGMVVATAVSYATDRRGDERVWWLSFSVAQGVAAAWFR